jgi:hypothetical protein
MAVGELRLLDMARCSVTPSLSISLLASSSGKSVLTTSTSVMITHSYRVTGIVYRPFDFLYFPSPNVKTLSDFVGPLIFVSFFSA